MAPYPVTATDLRALVSATKSSERSLVSASRFATLSSASSTRGGSHTRSKG
jgi:hypothetical protein